MTEEAHVINTDVHGFIPRQDIKFSNKTKQPLPYIIFKHKVLNSPKGATGVVALVQDAYFKLDCSGGHGSIEKAEQYLSKGYQIFEYYLPDRPKDDPFQGFTNFGDDENNLGQLRGFVLRQINTVPADEHKRLKDENKEMQRRLEAALKKQDKDSKVIPLKPESV